MGAALTLIFRSGPRRISACTTALVYTKHCIVSSVIQLERRQEGCAIAKALPPHLFGAFGLGLLEGVQLVSGKPGLDLP